jgi:hypothetical protein
MAKMVLQEPQVRRGLLVPPVKLVLEENKVKPVQRVKLVRPAKMVLRVYREKLVSLEPLV